LNSPHSLSFAGYCARFYVEYYDDFCVPFAPHESAWRFVDYPQRLKQSGYLRANTVPALFEYLSLFGLLLALSTRN
jgi:hypothetical protein